MLLIMELVFTPRAYRKVMGKQGLGVGNALLGGLAPDQSYYVRLYAENSAGSVWTGKQFLIRTQPEKIHLPDRLAMWFDATDINGMELIPYQQANRFQHGWTSRDWGEI